MLLENSLRHLTGQADTQSVGEMQMKTKPKQVMFPKNSYYTACENWVHQCTTTQITALECSFQGEVTLEITVLQMQCSQGAGSQGVGRSFLAMLEPPQLQPIQMDRRAPDSPRGQLGHQARPVRNLFFHFHSNIARHIRSPVTFQTLAFLPSRHWYHFGGDNFHSCNQLWAILIAFLITCWRMPITSSSPQKHMQLANQTFEQATRNIISHLREQLFVPSILHP